MLGCAALAVALGACEATVSGEAYGPGPNLEYVGPGVQVVADYDQPVFYSGGSYWLYSGDAWYRSPYYNGGWVYAAPPAAILSIRQPYAYVHYRSQGYRGGYAGRAQAQPNTGWRGGYATTPPPRTATGGWRGAPAAAPPPRPAFARPSGPPRVFAPPPARTARPVPQQQGRAAPAQRGWRPER
jgi:hypothetical protein